MPCFFTHFFLGAAFFFAGAAFFFAGAFFAAAFFGAAFFGAFFVATLNHPLSVTVRFPPTRLVRGSTRDTAVRVLKAIVRSCPQKVPGQCARACSILIFKEALADRNIVASP
jgi:predicted membrane protein